MDFCRYVSVAHIVLSVDQKRNYCMSKKYFFLSVKETIDNVSMVSVVFDPLGRIVLSNKKMRELGQKADRRGTPKIGEDLKIVLGGGKII